MINLASKIKSYSLQQFLLLANSFVIFKIKILFFIAFFIHYKLPVNQKGKSGIVIFEYSIVNI
jgi:hypothetical protein